MHVISGITILFLAATNAKAWSLKPRQGPSLFLGINNRTNESAHVQTFSTTIQLGATPKHLWTPEDFSISVGLVTDQGHRIDTAIRPASLDRIGVAWTVRSCIRHISDYGSILCGEESVTVPTQQAFELSFFRFERGDQIYQVIHSPYTVGHFNHVGFGKPVEVRFDVESEKTWSTIEVSQILFRNTEIQLDRADPQFGNMNTSRIYGFDGWQVSDCELDPMNCDSWTSRCLRIKAFGWAADRREYSIEE